MVAARKKSEGFLAPAGIREFMPVIESYRWESDGTAFERDTYEEVNRFIDTVLAGVKGQSVLTDARYAAILDSALLQSGERQVNLTGSERFEHAGALIQYAQDSAYIRFLHTQKLAGDDRITPSRNYFDNKDDLDRIFLDMASERGVTDGPLQIRAFEAQWMLMQIDACQKAMEPAFNSYFQEMIPGGRGNGR